MNNLKITMYVENEGLKNQEGESLEQAYVKMEHTEQSKVITLETYIEFGGSIEELEYTFMDGKEYEKIEIEYSQSMDKYISKRAKKTLEIFRENNGTVMLHGEEYILLEYPQVYDNTELYTAIGISTEGIVDFNYSEFFKKSFSEEGCFEEVTQYQFFWEYSYKEYGDDEIDYGEVLFDENNPIIVEEVKPKKKKYL
jgi:translation elongation factor P/translation initiation factor 5A